VGSLPVLGRNLAEALRFLEQIGGSTAASPANLSRPGTFGTRLGEASARLSP
jgi:hypothetical protein